MGLARLGLFCIRTYPPKGVSARCTTDLESQFWMCFNTYELVTLHLTCYITRITVLFSLGFEMIVFFFLLCSHFFLYTDDISGFSPRIDRGFPGEALNPFFGAQDEGFSDFCYT